MEQAETWFDRMVRRITLQEVPGGDVVARLAQADEYRRSLLVQAGQDLRELDSYLAAITAQPELQAHPEITAFESRARALRVRLFTALSRIAPDEAWYWTEEWQVGEREADAAITAGRTRCYASDDEFLAALDDYRAAHAHS